MKNKLITFELREDKDQVDIHLNKEGIDYMIKILEELRTGNTNDHFHLMTNSWGGDQLSEDKQSESSELLNLVTVYFWEK